MQISPYKRARRLNNSGEKPTLKLPSAQATTGRLITLLWARITFAALFASQTAALAPSSRRRQVVPARFSNFSQPSV